MRRDLTLSELRKSKGLSISFMAKNVETSEYNYKNWEENPGSMPVSIAKKTAKVLDADFDEIFLD